MSWLRIDDGFAEHYKISELSDREFRVWVRVLCYAARNNGREGRLTKAMRREIVGYTAAIERHLIGLGLLDEEDDGGVLAVHDWRRYNPRDPSAAERAKRYRERDEDRDGTRDADRDERRDEYRDETVTDTVTRTAPRARTGARDTVPSRNTGEESVSEKASPALPYLDQNAREAGQAVEQTDDFGGTA